MPINGENIIVLFFLLRLITVSNLPTTCNNLSIVISMYSSLRTTAGITLIGQLIAEL